LREVERRVGVMGEVERTIGGGLNFDEEETEETEDPTAVEMERKETLTRKMLSDQDRRRKFQQQLLRMQNKQVEIKVPEKKQAN
jgi:hypothetical protein